MVVLNPDSSTHVISVIPRYYYADILDYQLIDEDTNSIIVNTLLNQSLKNGLLIFELEFTAVNNKSYSLKVESETDGTIFFRGKAFATNQVTQNYRIDG